MTVRRTVAEPFVAAAKAAVPLEGAATAWRLLAADLALLETLEAQVAYADDEFARLLPATPFQTLATPGCWCAPPATAPRSVTPCAGRPRQMYRAAGPAPRVRMRLPAG